MKTLVIVGGILLAVAPWMSGGREPLALLITVFGLLVSAFLLYQRSKPKLAASFMLRWLTALWLGWGALSLIWSVNRFQTEMWLLYALIGVLVFTLAANLEGPEKQALLDGYIWLAGLTAVYGLYLYFSGDYDRLTTSFYWANPAAAYLLPAGLLAGWRWATTRSWIALLQALFIGSSFWLADSRGATVALVVALAIGGVARAGRRHWLPIVGILLLSFGLAAAGAQLRTQILHHQTVAPGSRFSEAAQGESTSVHDRLQYLRDGIAIWKDHPLLGTGAGSFGGVHPQYQRSATTATNDAHNIFVQTLAEQGLIGALILIYLFIVLAWGVWRGVWREPSFGIVALAALALSIHFGLDIDDRYPSLVALLAMLLGVVYKPWLVREAGRWQRYSAALLLLIALVLGVSYYRSDTSASNGRIYDDNHQLDLAALSYGKAHTGLVYDPDTWTAEGIDYYVLASITGGSPRYAPLARDRAQQAIARDPKDSQHYFLLARVERLDGHNQEAESAYRQALYLDHYNHPDYYLDLATLLLKEGNTSGAQKVVADGLSIYTDQVIANRSADSRIKPAVAELLVLRGAKGDLERALRLDPSNGDAQHLMGAPAH